MRGSGQARAGGVGNGTCSRRGGREGRLVPLSWGSGESSTGLPWLRNCEEPCERFCLCALRTDFRVKPSTFSAAEMAADMAGRRGGSPRAYIVPEGEAGGQKRKGLKKKNQQKNTTKNEVLAALTHHTDEERSGAGSAGRWGGSRVAPQFLLPSPFPPRAEPEGERKGGGGGGGGKGKQTNKLKDNFARRGGGGRAQIGRAHV